MTEKEKYEKYLNEQIATGLQYSHITKSIFDTVVTCKNGKIVPTTLTEEEYKEANDFLNSPTVEDKEILGQYSP